MASKKPIISSDFPVLREVLNDNNSLLIRESDPISLEIGKANKRIAWPGIQPDSLQASQAQFS